MPTLEELNEKINRIEQRNQKVELDKAWETSFVRRFLLMIFTFLAIGLYLNAIQVPNPWLNSIVPAIGFLLSTLTLPFVKQWWIRYNSKNK